MINMFFFLDIFVNFLSAYQDDEFQIIDDIKVTYYHIIITFS